MLSHLPEELTRARELMDQAKLDEALEIVEQFEKIESLSPEDQLLILVMKGRIYLYKQRTRKALQTFDLAYQMSQDLGLVPESVQALIGKAYIVFIGDRDEASKYVLDAEKKLETLAKDPSTGMLRRDLLLIKSWLLFFKDNYNEASKSAEECLRLTEEEKLGSKLDLALTFLLLGWIDVNQGNPTKALEYAMKSLELNTDLNHTVALADDYSLITNIYQSEGDYDKALQYSKQSLSIKEISKRSKLDVLWNLGQIYRLKNDMSRALKYRQQAVAFAEELNIPDQLIRNLIALGYLYRLIGKSDLALEYAERILTLSEKWDFIYGMADSLVLFIFTYIEEKSPEKANQYFSHLSELYDRTKDKGDIDISNRFLVSKAYLMKKSTRMRDRVEAQALFKELIDRTSEWDSLVFSMGNLCDLLLEELSLYNDPKILDEIVPLITKSLDIAEKAHNYSYLANTKLLQAKLALIQMDSEEAQKLMVQAQRIADLHDLNLLSSRISNEHDLLLEKVDEWDKLKKEDAPMVDRIKLASVDGVIDRLQGKRTVSPPELVNEEPILLLIMDNSGVTYFNHSFAANWDYSDLFSSFMSAFNTFMDEIFSKSIDRIRVGENTILINPVESFLTCYVIKGQSYPALQKLTRFTEAIRENSEIWDALEKSVKTSEMLELDKLPALKTVIDEIFN